MEMKQTKAIAAQRRADLLAEKERLGCTNIKLGLIHGLTAVRIGQMINKALAERIAKGDTK